LAEAPLAALISLMERNADYWKKIKGSQALQVFGYEGYVEPEPVEVNVEHMIDLIKVGIWPPMKRKLWWRNRR
jgi:hypothetical protein